MPKETHRSSSTEARERGRGLSNARTIRGLLKGSPRNCAERNGNGKAGHGDSSSLGSCRRSRARTPPKEGILGRLELRILHGNAGKIGLGSMDNSEPHLRERDGNSESDKGARGFDRMWAEQGEYPSPKSRWSGRSEDARRETPSSSNANSRTASTGAIVRSWWWQKSVGHIALSRALERETSRDDSRWLAENKSTRY